MGRKVHPIGFRLGIHQLWEGRWYAEGADYTNQLHQDFAIRKLIHGSTDKAGVSKVEVERFPGKVKVIVHTAKPGILIGRKGDTVKVIRQNLEALTGKKIDLEIKEIKSPDCDAYLVAPQYCRPDRTACQLPACDEACRATGHAPGRVGHQVGSRRPFERCRNGA